MNSKLLLAGIVLVTFASCTSAYKSGQTPDDVYYSPVRLYKEDKKQDEDRKEELRDYSSDDRQIRLGINNRRWRSIDYDISYNPYLYGYNYGYYYNPYYCQFPVYNTIIATPANPKITTPRTTSLAGYNTPYNNTNVAVNPKTGYVNPIAPVRTYQNGGSRLGNTLGKVLNTATNSSQYNNSNQSTNSNNNSSNRTYSPSSSGTKSSSSGSSSSGGGSVSRPTRSGKG
ncbi:MAG: hypothetical protein RL172_1762 [Bacteroidota bacterium]|jgi:uncharacterized membrane protein YgcG